MTENDTHFGSATKDESMALRSYEYDLSLPSLSAHLDLLKAGRISKKYTSAAGGTTRKC